MEQVTRRGIGQPMSRSPWRPCHQTQESTPGMWPLQTEDGQSCVELFDGGRAQGSPRQAPGSPG